MRAKSLADASAIVLESFLRTMVHLTVATLSGIFFQLCLAFMTLFLQQLRKICDLKH